LKKIDLIVIEKIVNIVPLVLKSRECL